MKAIVYGHERTVEKLVVLLTVEGIEAEGVFDGPYKTVVLQTQGDFDLAIVDSQTEATEEACHHIKASRDIPLVLIVNPKEADWRKLQLLDADAYLPEKAEGNVLAARLRAVLRRFRPAGQVAKRNLVPEHMNILTKASINFTGIN